MAPQRTRGDRRYGDRSVFKDPLDLRDLMFEGSLTELPHEIDYREYVPFILDQKSEGACTGFALAAVANFLLHNHRDRRALREPVSARMLYELAKRYDEWDGENYAGSSIRGAMKGWKRHGACRESLWPYRLEDPGALTPEAALDAHSRPLGNYFRVRHLHLSHMHAGLAEVGALLASANVHAGWEDLPRRGKPRIPFRRGSIGGHAFAIVGYDDEGFWIQNSWGERWGNGGFAHLSYEDWLENGWDCWVARLGVPTAAITSEATGTSGRAAVFDYIEDESLVLARVKGHYLRLGNDGQLAATGRLGTRLEDLERVFRERVPTALDAGEASRLLLYAHGGLNSEMDSARRIATFLPTFMGNGIYPLHFMWRTDLIETFKNIARDVFRSRRMQGWRDELRERFADLLDGAIELASRGLGRALWREMKENARLATESADGAAGLAASEVLALVGARPELEVHLVGHSAGAIFQAHVVRHLATAGVPIRSLSFFAPACTMALFRSHVLPHIGQGVEAFALFNLTDQAEQADAVGPYGKSLLYLVSNAFEERKGTRLLGLEQRLSDDRETRDLRTQLKPLHQGATTKIRGVGIAPSRRLASESATHGGFDNDEHTLNSALRIILRKNTLERPFPD